MMAAKTPMTNAIELARCAALPPTGALVAAEAPAVVVVAGVVVVATLSVWVSCWVTAGSRLVVGEIVGELKE